MDTHQQQTEQQGPHINVTVPRAKKYISNSGKEKNLIGFSILHIFWHLQNFKSGITFIKRKHITSSLDRNLPNFVIILGGYLSQSVTVELLKNLVMIMME